MITWKRIGKMSETGKMKYNRKKVWMKNNECSN